MGKHLIQITRRRTTSRGLLAVIGIVAALGLLLASCGGNGDEDGTSTRSPTPTRRASPTRTAARASASPITTGVEIELDEFAIRPKQTRALPGTINFQISNVGEVPHELVVVKSDLPVAELPRLPGDAGVDEDGLDVEGRLDEPLDAGADGELSLDLEVGQYIVICNLSPNGESHYLNGMYTGFEIRTDAPQSSPTP